MSFRPPIGYTPWAQYDLYINGICRCSITLPGCQDANGNPIPGTKTNEVTVIMVPKWRGPSAYAVTLVKPAPLGSSGSIQYENPNDGSTNAQVINGPRLDFNLGLAKNGVTLPPLSVARALVTVSPPPFPICRRFPRCSNLTASSGSRRRRSRRSFRCKTARDMALAPMNNGEQWQLHYQLCHAGK